MSSDSDEDVITVLFAIMQARARVDRPKRSCWIHPYYQIREQEGTILNKIAELRMYPDKFRNFTRMKIETFDYLLELIQNRISKRTTNYRRSISPPERLIITLRYLATGDSFKSLSYFFRCGTSTIEKIVPETCSAIWEALSPIYMKKPNEEKWKSIAEDFEKLWNFPNCVGAIDGKHVRLQRPSGAGSEYFNYKQFHSIHLMAVADANAQFIYVDVGDYGRNCDSGVLHNSSFGKSLINNDLQLPDKKKLCAESNEKVPFVFVAVEAYPLRLNLMKPFSRKNLSKETKIYNYRLSRARRIVECAFGILAKKFRIFEKTILLSPSKAASAVLAACVLHNMIRQRENQINDISCENEASIQNSVEDYNDQRDTSRPSNAARTVRNTFVEYFNSSIGSVAWQDNYIN